MGTFTIGVSQLGGGDLLRGPEDEPDTPDVPDVPEPPAPTVGGSGGWFTLLSIEQEIRLEATIPRPLVDCPVCGTTLVMNSKGEIRCPWDGWSYA